MKRYLRPLFQLLSLLVFAWIVWASGEEAWQSITSGIPRFILAALLLRGLAGMLATTRLQLNTQGIARQRLGWRRLYYVTMTTRALGLIIPRSLSTIGGKSVALKTQGISTRRAIWIVLIDNLYDVALLGVMTLPAMLVIYGTISKIQGAGLTVLLLILGAGLIWWGTHANRLTAVFLWLQRYPLVVNRFGGALDPEERLLPSPRQALAAYVTAVLLNGSLILSFYFIGQALGMSAGLAVFAVAFPLTQLSLVAAVTPGGLGIFDLGWLGLLRLAGVPEEQALTFVVAQRAYVTIFVLVWTGVSIALAFTESVPVRLPGKDPQS